MLTSPPPACITVPCLNTKLSTMGHVCLVFTTSELCPVVLAMLEDGHPNVLGAGFTISLSWLNKLILEQMQLPLRATSTYHPSKDH